MNKADLASEVAKRTKLSKSKAIQAIDAALDCIKVALKKGQRCQLVGFGSFTVRKRNARTGRNPKTGEAIQIAAKRVPAFVAGQALKQAVK